MFKMDRFHSDENAQLAHDNIMSKYTRNTTNEALSSIV